ncbi:hypothetical protein ACFFVB_12520 [Formosa undariae]|uniref:Uncharacterized protein n=1 Tax=Formosa undariae TaxID=1325436 RepID=A0ABV5F380_9FLAO
MKPFIFILVLFILFKPVWLLVEYVANYDYIVEKLCENRDQPALQCNGKCYLAKRISGTTEEGEKSPLWSALSKFDLEMINLKDTHVFPIGYFESPKKIYKWHAPFVGGLFTLDILQPPQFLLKK